MIKNLKTSSLVKTPKSHNEVYGFKNVKTGRFNSENLAIKNGLFKHPSNFLLPPNVGLNLMSKKVQSLAQLRKLVKSKQLNGSDVFIPGYLVLPISQTLVKSNKSKINKLNQELAKLKQIEQDNITFSLEISLYRKLQLSSRVKKGVISKNGDQFVLIKDMTVQTKDVSINSYPKMNYYNDDMFSTLDTILCEDSNYRDLENKALKSSDLGIIQINSITEMKGSTKLLHPLDVPLHKSMESKYMYSKYLKYETSKNKTAQSFAELFTDNVIIPDKIKVDQADNSCFVNLLHAVYYEPLNVLKSDGSRRYDELTKDKLYSILNISTERKQDIGLSVRNSIPFFEKYHLGLDVLNVFNTCIFRYRPEKMNTTISPEVLIILIHNNHVYRVNKNVKKLQQIIRYDPDALETTEATIDAKLCTLKNTYNIVNFKTPQQHIVVKDIHDIMDKIHEMTEDTTLLVNGNIKNTLFKLLNAGYTPGVLLESGNIKELHIGINAGTVTVRDCAVEDGDENNYQLTTQTRYDNYMKAYKSFYEGILTEGSMSSYNATAKQIDDVLPMGPMSGYLGASAESNLYGIDMRKAYTDCLMKMTHIPVFGYFDIYKSYDNHAIEDETIYIVECKSKSVEETILFPSEVSRCYGLKLKFAKSIEYTIISFKRPSNRVACDFTKLVNELYDTEIDADKETDNELKKKIVNVILGVVEKKSNKRSTSQVCTVYEDAMTYQLQCGGNIYPVVEIEEAKPVPVEVMDDGLDFGVDVETVKSICTTQQAVKQLNKAFIYNCQAKRELVSGFLPIKEMVYEIQKMKLYSLYKQCVSHGLNVKGLKTDCVLISPTEEADLMALFDCENKVGKFKIETEKTAQNVRICQTNLITIDLINTMLQSTKLVVYDIVNERDSSEINKIFDGNSNVLICGQFPGVGKTTSVKNYNKPTLFVAPYNKLCLSLKKDGFEAITLNKLLGMYIDGKDANSKPYDVSPFEVICFDEVMLYKPAELARIHKFMISKPDIKFVATGDTDQNKPFGYNLNNVVDIVQYIKDCIDIMFPAQISLKVNKRLKTDEDRAKLAGLKVDVFNKDISIRRICKKYGIKTETDFENVKTKSNITYFNDYARKVNEHIHAMCAKTNSKTKKINGIKYYPGLELICNTHHQIGKLRCYVNYTYVIKSVNSAVCVLEEPNEGTIITIKSDSLNMYFGLPYAYTCHSVQGLSINDKITIFNANIEQFCNRNWFWTALTRATELNNITVFLHSKEEIEEMSDNRKLMTYFKNKVSGYIDQDNNKGRLINKSKYVTADWIMSEYQQSNKECTGCHKPFEFQFGFNSVKSNLSVDRRDNKEAHHRDNCELLCVQCNCAKH